MPAVCFGIRRVSSLHATRRFPIPQVAGVDGSVRAPMPLATLPWFLRYCCCVQATCTYLRLLAVVSGDGKVMEEASMELVAVLQVRQKFKEETWGPADARTCDGYQDLAAHGLQSQFQPARSR